MFHRRLSDYGIHRIVFYILAPLLFITASFIIFEKIEHAEYFYIGIAVYTQAILSNQERNTFLKSQFEHSTLNIIRHSESLLLASPFLLILIYKQFYLVSILLLLIVLIFPFIKIKSTSRFILPSPFSKQPFEFLVGTRKSILLMLFGFFLIGIAIYVGNFNLGLFGLVLLPLTTLNFYTEPEHSYYMWVHAFTPNQFLNYKIKQGWIHYTILNLIGATVLICAFPHQFILVLISLGIGYLYLTTIILAKYTMYPRFIQIGMIIIIVISFAFPLLLFILIPLLYKKAILNLNLQLA